MIVGSVIILVAYKRQVNETSEIVTFSADTVRKRLRSGIKLSDKVVFSVTGTLVNSNPNFYPKFLGCQYILVLLYLYAANKSY